MDLNKLLGVFGRAENGSCAICGLKAPTVSKGLGVCKNCILQESEEALAQVLSNRVLLREQYELPSMIPRKPNLNAKKEKFVSYKTCKGCVNECELTEGESGFCGLRRVRNGRLEVIAGTPRGALVEWYYDKLPTNCVANFVCAGGTGAGYPKYAHKKNRPELGYKNLAVFYRSCTFDCIYCQNYHFRYAHPEGDDKYDANAIGFAAGAEDTSCICFFGGDPTPQLTHSLAAGRLARENAGENEIKRICWESNGSMPWGLARAMGNMALESGGCIKFDIKAKNEDLHRALCGTSNKNTFDNFRRLWDKFGTERTDPPLLIASTLMVPGYIEVDEVKDIAEFIADLDKSIPYALLAFHPDFNMFDMGTTTRSDAEACKKAAESAGLTRVNLGNMHLLS